MLVSRDDGLVSFPQVGVAMSLTISLWQSLPKLATRGFTPIADDISHHLAGQAAQRQPDPAFVGPFEHKGPQFIQFQDQWPFWNDQALAQDWQLAMFFLSQLLTVLRETPKVRLNPRRLLRS